MQSVAQRISLPQHRHTVSPRSHPHHSAHNATINASVIDIGLKTSCLRGSEVQLATGSKADRPQSRQYDRRTCTVRCGYLARTKELVKSNQVAVFPSSEVARLVKEGSWKLLDIRPEWERERASVSGSLHVPFFIEDTASDLLTVAKKQVVLGFGGLWLGSRLTKENEAFLEQVLAAADGDKAAPLIIACNEGLRSLLAVDRLHAAGFTKLAWFGGGFNASADKNFLEAGLKIDGTTQLRFAAAGGMQGQIIKYGEMFLGKQQ